MKTAYDQHFKKIKQTTKAPAFNIEKSGVKVRKAKKNAADKKTFPVMPLFSFVLIAALGLLLLENFDSVDSYLKKIEISVDTAQAADAPVDPKKVEATAVGVGDQKAISVEAKPIDDTDYLFKLADRKKQLDAREQQLNTIADKLKKQEQDINEKLAKLEAVRGQVSSALEERIKADSDKIETLVQMYTNMKPVQAAKIFETLDEDLVIEILGRMKKKNAADILNLVKHEKAKDLAERYTGYRAPASQSN